MSLLSISIAFLLVSGHIGVPKHGQGPQDPLGVPRVYRLRRMYVHVPLWLWDRALGNGKTASSLALFQFLKVKMTFLVSSYN